MATAIQNCACNKCLYRIGQMFCHDISERLKLGLSYCNTVIKDVCTMTADILLCNPGSLPNSDTIIKSWKQVLLEFKMIHLLRY